MNYSPLINDAFINSISAYEPPSVTSPIQKRPYLSAQRRYDNIRVSESAIQQRVCFDCGRIVHGNDSAFQNHIISHEAALICYQIYHFEKGTTLPKEFYGSATAKLTKQQPVETAKSSQIGGRRKTGEMRTLNDARVARRTGNVVKRMRKPKAIKPAILSIERPLTIATTSTRSSAMRSSTHGEYSRLLSEESDATHITDASGRMSNASFISEPEIELPVDDGDDYVPQLSRGSTSSRGRTRKPKQRM